MSNIVAFSPDRRGRFIAREAVAGGAQILFFMGIRYVRPAADEAVMDGSAGARPAIAIDAAPAPTAHDADERLLA